MLYNNHQIRFLSFFENNKMLFRTNHRDIDGNFIAAILSLIMDKYNDKDFCNVTM